MDAALPAKYQLEPWKQAKITVIEHINALKQLLATPTSQQEGHQQELMLTLVAINDHLRASCTLLVQPTS